MAETALHVLIHKLFTVIMPHFMLFGNRPPYSLPFTSPMWKLYRIATTALHHCFYIHCISSALKQGERGIIPVPREMADIIDPHSSLKDMVRLQGEVYYEYVDRKTALKSDFIHKAYNSSRTLCKRGCRSVSIRDYDDFYWSTTATYMDFLRTGSLQCAAYDFEDATKLYRLGESVEDIEFRDAVMDLLFIQYRDDVENGTRWVLEQKMISEVYDHTAVGSPLRKFVVDIHIWANSAGPERGEHLNPDESDDQAMPIPQAFFKDLIEAKMAQDGVDLASFAKVLINNGAKATLRTAPTVDLEPETTDRTCAFPSGVSVCDYHVHEPGALCANRKRKRAAEGCTT